MALRQEIFEVNSPHRIDSDATIPSGQTAVATDKDTAESYREVGNILLDAEQSYLGVGIPLLISCIQLDAIVAKKPPLDDFLQQSLVNINTPTLLRYAKDLESSELSTSDLHIQLADHQRYFFPIVTILGSALLLLSFLLICGFSKEMATILAVFLASCAGYIACESVRDNYRRSSFQKTIEIEIQRRHGRGGTTVTAAIKLNPLCE